MIRSLLLDWQYRLDVSATSRLFIRSINLVGFGLILWMLPISNMVWGDAHFSILYHDFQGLDSIAVLLRFDGVRQFYWVFLMSYLGLTLLGLLGFSNAVSRFATWLIILILYYGNYDVSNGGWHMLIQLHFLSIFLFNPDTIQNETLKALANFTHNVAFRFIWIQIAFMYFTSGVQKLFGNYWLNGEALLLVLNRPEFSLPFLFENLAENTFWLKLGTWCALGYQLLFPFVIWIKRLRPWILVMGLIFHLFILIFMGITDFALILIAAYTVFIEPKNANRLLRYLRLE